jgi:ABC-type nitrate/sulfonate/bicarbonate transport system ATPase subunit
VNPSILVGDPVFRRAIVGRTLVVWGAVRGAAWFFGMRVLGSWQLLLVFGAVSVAILVDARRRSEDRGREVLKAASLWAPAGTIVTLLGRNGSGKSTLMKIAAGWMWADCGSVRWRGSTRRRPSLAGLAREELLYSPQDTMLSANFTLGAHFEAVARRFGRRRLDEAVGALRLDGLLDRSPKHLSGAGRFPLPFEAAVTIRRPVRDRRGPYG